MWCVGWLEYAAYQNTEGFDSFLGKFSVPDEPQAQPQVLYLFTGLQNIKCACFCWFVDVSTG